jgi:tetratricopeptide (TPR) repeat protein
MKTVRISWVRMAVAFASLTAPAWAQQGGGARDAAAEDPALFAQEETPAIARKEPSLFLRPKKSDPASQLERARDFETRGKRSAALSAYRALIHTWHQAPEALPAQQAIARIFEERGLHDRAFQEYQYLLTHFAGQAPYLDVVARQYELANHLDVPRRNFLGLNLRSPESSRLRFEQIARNAPNWVRTPEVLLKVGACLEDENEPTAAADLYARLQARYPKSAAAPEAAGREITCRYTLAHKHPKDEGLRLRAMTAMDAAMAAHPNHPDRARVLAWREELGERQAEAAYERALFYDSISKQPRAALHAYREFLRQYPGSSRTAAVRERVRQLETETTVVSP